jgi:starch synthase
MKSIRVLSVASAILPLMKTGGLADVVGALPIALTPAHSCLVIQLKPGHDSSPKAQAPCLS